jgi:uncharacterized protein (TIGR03435 family)
MPKSKAGFIYLSLAAMVFGQASFPPSFEVASIKPHPGVVTFSSDPKLKGNRVTATASTLLDMITTAYRVRYDQISAAPGWASSEPYDLEARAGEQAITIEQMRSMLQALLADRFQLRLHRETRTIPMFALVVGKHGRKFQESSPADDPKSTIIADGKGMHLEFARQTMANLAARLSNNGAGRPVIDGTGLTGQYTFKLEWAPENPGHESDLPSLANALQEQLGVELEPTKGSGEFIVIDQAQKPSAN